MSEINELRKRVYQLQRRTGAKLGRLESQKNVRESRKIDPRKPGGWVAHASSRELNAQIKRLETFNSAKTQFYGDAKGVPMAKKSWDAYKREERQFNEWRADYFDAVKGVKLRNNLTIEQASKLRGYKHSARIDDFTEAKNVSSAAFMSEAKLIQRTKEMSKLNRGGLAGMSARGRANFNAMSITEVLQDQPFVARVNALNDDQFALLWSATDFRKHVGTNYEVLKSGVTLYNSGVESQAMENIEELLDWVESPKTRQAIERSKKKLSTFAPKGSTKRKVRRK